VTRLENEESAKGEADGDGEDERGGRREGEASAMVTWRDARTMVIRAERMKERVARAKDQTEEDQSNGVSVGDYLQMRTR
jgi:hypothetical protein